MSAAEKIDIPRKCVSVDDNRAVLEQRAKYRKAARATDGKAAEIARAKAKVADLEADHADLELQLDEERERMEDLVRDVRVKYDIPTGHLWDDITREISTAPVALPPQARR